MSHAPGCPARTPRPIEAPRRTLRAERSGALVARSPARPRTPVAPAPVRLAPAPIRPTPADERALHEAALELFGETFTLLRSLAPLQSLGAGEVGRGALAWLTHETRLAPALGAMDTLLHLLTDRLTRAPVPRRG